MCERRNIPLGVTSTLEISRVYTVKTRGVWPAVGGRGARMCKIYRAGGGGWEETREFYGSPGFDHFDLKLSNRATGRNSSLVGRWVRPVPGLRLFGWGKFQFSAFIDRRVHAVFFLPERARPLLARKKEIYIISTFRWESRTESDCVRRDENHKCSFCFPRPAVTERRAHWIARSITRSRRTSWDHDRTRNILQRDANNSIRYTEGIILFSLREIVSALRMKNMSRCHFCLSMLWSNHPWTWVFLIEDRNRASSHRWEHRSCNITLSTPNSFYLQKRIFLHLLLYQVV